MARTPQEAFETHLAALGSGDLDTIAADYSDNCIQICNSQIRRGKEGVKEGFAALLAELAAAGEIKGLEVPVRVYEDNVLYIEWWADLGDMRCDGVDTFVFEGGLITIQTVKYDISKAN
jgi:ketosteroid isomerase-like protein